MKSRHLTVIKSTLISTFALISLAFVPQAVQAQEPGQSGLVTLDVQDCELKDVLLMLMRQSGVNIVLNTQKLQDKRVTAVISNQTVERALNTIMAGFDVPWYRRDDGSFIIGAASPEPVATAPAASAGQAAQPVESPKTFGPKVVRLIPIKFMDAADIRSLLVDGKLPPRGFKVNLTPLSLRSMERNYKGRYPQLEERINSMRVGADPQGAPSASDSLASSLFTSVGSLSPTFIMQVGGRPPGGPQGLGAAGAGQGLLPEGIEAGSIIVYDTDNSLLVRGSEEAIDALREIIDVLDRPQRQIEIKTTFVEVGVQESKGFGIDWQMTNGGTQLNLGNMDPGGNVRVGFAIGNASGRMGMIDTLGRGRVVNAPIITTINNRPADIFVVQNIPVTRREVIILPGGGTTTVTNYDIIPSVTQLSVTPRLNADNTISVFVAPTVSEVSRFVNIPDVGEIPVITEHFIATERVVNSGDTIVLGGLVRQKENQSVTRVPFLADLPLIGGLFRGTNRSQDNTELLIFLTPREITSRKATNR